MWCGAIDAAAVALLEAAGKDVEGGAGDVCDCDEGPEARLCTW